MKNYYARLEIPLESDLSTIREAYRRLIQLNVDDKEAFNELQEAYDVLTNPARRAEYDKSAGGSTLESSRSNGAAAGRSTPRCPMAAEAQCPVLNGRSPQSEIYCAECGVVISEMLTAPPEPAQPVQEGKPAYLEEETGRQHPLTLGENLVGRDSAPILIPDKTVSRQHAIVRVDSQSIIIEDLGSTNGTQVNGTRLPPHSTREVIAGDTIRFGSIRTMLRFPSAARGAQPEAVDHDMMPGVVKDVEPPSAVMSILGILDEAEMYAPVSAYPTLAPERAGVKPAVNAKLISIRGDVVGEYPLIPGVTTFGRRSENNIVIKDDPYVSGSHAQIIADGDEFRLTDVGSTNGTLLNGERIAADDPIALANGDNFAIGGTNFRFERVGPAPA